MPLEEFREQESVIDEEPYQQDASGNGQEYVAPSRGDDVDVITWDRSDVPYEIIIQSSLSQGMRC